MPQQFTASLDSPSQMVCFAVSKKMIIPCLTYCTAGDLGHMLRGRDPCSRSPSHTGNRSSTGVSQQAFSQ